MNQAKVDTRKFDMIKSAATLVIPRKTDHPRNEIQLFLSNNYIFRIPSELSRLKNLVVLSLSQSDSRLDTSVCIQR